MPFDFVALAMILFLAVPAIAVMGLASGHAIHLPLRDRTVGRITSAALVVQLTVALFLFVQLWESPSHSLVFDLGTWWSWKTDGSQFKFYFDWLSGPLTVMASLLMWIIGHFSVRYLKKDPGFFRFFLFLLLFDFGIDLIFLAGNWNLLIVGWEIVGLTSVFLIGFYQYREGPAANARFTWVTYRLCDFGLLGAAMWWHHAFETSDLPLFLQPLGVAPSVMNQPHALAAIGALAIIASIGKSAQLPASAWLPKAMEGPTPSSAIFYGALSVHAGAYLLLRLYPVWSQVPFLGAVIFSIGFLTAGFASFSGHTRVDAKSLLAYATMGQVGLIFMEIGLGFPRFALFHILGHSVLRTFQFLRAPSALYDFQQMGLGAARESKSGSREWLSLKARVWLYRQAVAGANLEAFVGTLFFRPLGWLAEGIDKLECSLLKLFVSASRSKSASKADYRTARGMGKTV